jgi:hypothetical protein
VYSHLTPVGKAPLISKEGIKANAGRIFFWVPGFDPMPNGTIVTDPVATLAAIKPSKIFQNIFDHFQINSSAMFEIDPAGLTGEFHTDQCYAPGVACYVEQDLIEPQYLTLRKIEDRSHAFAEFYGSAPEPPRPAHMYCTPQLNWAREIVLNDRLFDVRPISFFATSQPVGPIVEDAAEYFRDKTLSERTHFLFEIDQKAIECPVRAGDSTISRGPPMAGEYKVRQGTLLQPAIEAKYLKFVKAYRMWGELYRDLERLK